MTLSEAIIHCEEVADRCAATDGNLKCEMQHRQLAEWLKELQCRRAEQRWIPITERLPDEYEYVLLCDRELEPDEDTGYSQMAVGWLEDGKLCCWDDGAVRKEFVAWMPLPEAYREEGDS